MPESASPTVGTRDHEELLDSDVYVLMRDGKMLFGAFRSFDQFNNITLEEAVERKFFDEFYSERRIGLCIIRGDNVLLIGKSEENLSKYKLIEYDSINKMAERSCEIA